jgi:hypothetical protein
VTERPNILKLIETGRNDEAVAVLTEGFCLAAAAGDRSSKAALETATRLYGGDVVATAKFMNRQHPWLGGQTPIARAKESEKGLENRDRHDPSDRSWSVHLMTEPTLPVDPVQHGGAGLRTFLNIAELWSLSDDEQARILNVYDRVILEDWKARARADEITAIPVDMLTRIGCVLSIYASLVTLLAKERAADWIRAPNKGSVFGGSSALAMMSSGNLEDLDSVARYLLGQIYS